MRLEGPESRIPRLHHRQESDKNVTGKGEGGSEVEVTGNTNRSPILLWLSQLLPTVHPGLLKSSKAPHGVNKKGTRKGMDLEPRSGSCHCGTLAAIHLGRNSDPIQPSETGHD